MSNTELIAELRQGDGNGCKHPNDVMRRAASALEAAEQELADAQAIIVEIRGAWLVPGRARAFHGREQERLRQVWPTLANAVTRAVGYRESK